MKKIGVISDTHLQKPDKRLDTIVSTHFLDVDMIIHAGDMVKLEILDPFYATDKEVLAVAGNMDSVAVQDTFPIRQIIEIENLTIGIIHGWGAPKGLRTRIRSAFDHVNAIIYGHTHHPFCATEDGIFFFNPGSPTDSRFTSSPSIGIIEIDDKHIQGEIINL